MKEYNILIYTVIVTALCITGCKPRDPLENVVFIESSSVRVTAAEVRDSVLLKREIQILAKHPINDRKFAKWANSTAFKTIHGILANHLLDVEFRRMGIRPTPESDRAVLLQHNKAMHLNAASKEEIALHFGLLSRYYLRQFDFESKKSAYLNEVKKSVAISDKQVKESLDRMEMSRIIAERCYTNAFEKAENAWKKLAAGGEWVEVANEYSEDSLLDETFGKYCREWETIPPIGNYMPVEVANAVRKLKAGEYTRPIVTDEGLLIVRVVKVDEDGYHCSRINFRLPIVPSVPTESEMRRRLTDQAVNNALSDLIKDLHSKQKFTYPMGTNITYEIFK